ARFLVGADQERSLVKVYDKIAGSLDTLPAGASPPWIKSRTIDDVPVLGVTLWGHGYDAYTLRRLAAELGRELGALDEVAEIRLHGGQPRQIRVLLDPQRLAAAGLDPLDVASAIRSQNATLAAGSFEQGNREVLVETGAFLESARDVEALVVGTSGGHPIYLSSVAEVLDRPSELTSQVFYRAGVAHGLARTLGRGAGAEGSAVEAGLHLSVGGAPLEGLYPAVTLTVAKRKGADAHRVAQAALGRIGELRGDLLPRDLELTVVRDYGATANEKASELLLHLSLAIVSVTLVIGLFLGWRGALVVLFSVPISFALTLFVYYIFGYTLNRVTLFALIFVTGIVVDDSIIVVENIVRHLSMKTRNAKEAVLHAVSEVGNPTILATLTVIASVLPMAFVSGLMGPYMRPMPVGASLAMAFSLVVALVATPWLAARLVRGEANGHGAADGHTSGRADSIYRRLLGPLLESRVRAWLFLG
ncbi:MAG: efflux RND transporter permease subunit, partial [Holophagales bacterium]|nr:efflux RND transporter permease subunit [Holophagales bacterium]